MGYRPDQNIAWSEQTAIQLLFKFRLFERTAKHSFYFGGLRRVGGGGGERLRGSNKPPLQVNINDGGLKTQVANFKLLANSGGMENKLWVF